MLSSVKYIFICYGEGIKLCLQGIRFFYCKWITVKIQQVERHCNQTCAKVCKKNIIIILLSFRVE